MWQLTQIQYWPALLGLIIPLLIHLWRRRKPRVLLFPILRFLTMSDRTRIHRIQLHNIWLLLVRMLLLGLFAFWVLGPVYISMKSDEGRIRKWVLAHNSVLGHSETALQIKQFLNRGFELHFLTDNFDEVYSSIPENLNTGETNEFTKSSWDILRILKNGFSETDTVVVFADPFYEKLMGSKPEFQAVMQYYTIPVTMDYPYLLDAHRNNSQIEVSLGNLQDGNLIVNKQNLAIAEKIQQDYPNGLNSEQMVGYPSQWSLFDHYGDSIIIDARARINILIVSDEAADRYQKWVTAALESIDAYLPDQMEWKHTKVVQEDQLNEFKIVFWLSEQVPLDMNKDQILIELNEDIYSYTILMKQAGESKWFFTPRTFVEEANYPIELPEILTNILFDKPEVEDRMKSRWGLIANAGIAKPTFTAGTKISESISNPKSFDYWFACALLILIALERILSRKRIASSPNEN